MLVGLVFTLALCIARSEPATTMTMSIAVKMMPKRAPTRLPTLPNRRIGDLPQHHWISANYSLPSWQGQVQTKFLANEEGAEQQHEEQ
jgi:hypothetical protein